MFLLRSSLRSFGKTNITLVRVSGLPLRGRPLSFRPFGGDNEREEHEALEDETSSAESSHKDIDSSHHGDSLPVDGHGRGHLADSGYELNADEDFDSEDDSQSEDDEDYPLDDEFEDDTEDFADNDAPVDERLLQAEERQRRRDQLMLEKQQEEEAEETAKEVSLDYSRNAAILYYADREAYMEAMMEEALQLPQADSDEEDSESEDFEDTEEDIARQRQEQQDDEEVLQELGEAAMELLDHEIHKKDHAQSWFARKRALMAQHRRFLKAKRQAHQELLDKSPDTVGVPFPIHATTKKSLNTFRFICPPNLRPFLPKHIEELANVLAKNPTYTPKEKYNMLKRVAVELVNLGSPNWKPPQFYRDAEGRTVERDYDDYERRKADIDEHFELNMKALGIAKNDRNR